MTPVTPSPRRSRSRFVRLLAPVLLVSMVAAACSDDDKSSTTTAAPVVTDAPSSTNGAPSTDAPGTSDAPSSTDAETDPLAPKPLDKQTTVTVGVTSVLEHTAPVTLGNVLGEFEKENIKIQINQMPSADGFTLLAQGDLDVSWNAPSAAFFNAVNSGFNLKWVAGNYTQTAASKAGLWARREAFADPSKPAPEELSKLTIGSSIGPGSVISYALQAVLKKSGLSIEDVTLAQYPSADLLVALQNGAVNGAWLNDPVWVEAEKSDDLVFIGGASETDPMGGAFFGPSLLEKNPEAGEAFVRAMLRTIRDHLSGDYHENEETVAKLAELFSQDPETIRTAAPLNFHWELPVGLAEGIQEVYLFVPDLLEYTTPLSDQQTIDRHFYELAMGK